MNLGARVGKQVLLFIRHLPYYSYNQVR